MIVKNFNHKKFCVTLKNGSFSSIKPGKSVYGEGDTQIVLKEKQFNKLLVTYSTEKEVKSIDLDQMSNRIVEQTSNDASYHFEVDNDELKINKKINVLEDCMTEEFEIQNISGEILTLLDVGFAIPCNNDFSWGVAGSNKVIGHNFVGGDSSHFLFQRCDGQGPSLLVLPTNVSMEYYALDSEKQPVVYIHSNHVTKDIPTQHCKMSLKATKLLLKPNEKTTITFKYFWVNSNAEAKKCIIENGMVDIEVMPGLTVPEKTKVLMAVGSKYDDITVNSPSRNFVVEHINKKGDYHIYQMEFSSLGEKEVLVGYNGNKTLSVKYFVTEDIETLIKKRASFIVKTQHKNPEEWYYGLLGEYNNETGALLGPDNYDKIKGWRIYEVTCDDPGLSKPAFLSSKLVEYPNEEEITALDLYVEKFLWGGLQCTEEEIFPYGIYGIPDWKQNRESKEAGVRGKMHLWRIYDYPHIALVYYNLYLIAKNNKDANLSQDAMTYLNRAYNTALAMFNIPMELERWDACKTGLYNELVIVDIIKALGEEGLKAEALRLSIHWDRKINYFVNECKDLYGSEYPFDTTGFESTHIIAKNAIEIAKDESGVLSADVNIKNANDFMLKQTQCNLACRGCLEPAYYWYGSDYRGNNAQYMLSYMSQMGGWSLLDYALYYAENPYEILRIAYASVLSSWALMNTGREESDYGYWFSGKENDGCAGGGFEPMATGTTWLEQLHYGGSWYYSCEIDLGFCGGIRAAATVVANDPLFGMVCYGGEMRKEADKLIVSSSDGVSKRFHYMNASDKIHFTLDKGSFSDDGIIFDGKTLSVALNPLESAVPTVAEIEVQGYIIDEILLNHERVQVNNATKMNLLVPSNNQTQIITIKLSKGTRL